MPSLDLIDEMRSARDTIIKSLAGHKKCANAQRTSELVDGLFASLIEFADDERREWDKVLTFLMDKEWDDN